MDRSFLTYCQWEVNRIPPTGLSPRLARQFMDEVTPISQLLKRGVASIGRANANTLRTPSVLSSRKHCSIILKSDGSLFIIDHKSLNGTYLQNARILPERETALADNDVIGIGADPSMDFIDEQHQPNSHFIFKITRKILSKDEKAFCDQETVVPALAGGLCNYNVQSSSVIDEPSTSTSNIPYKSENQKNLEIPGKKESPQTNKIGNDVVVIDLSDDEDDCLIETVDKNIPPDQPENEKNQSADKIILDNDQMKSEEEIMVIESEKTTQDSGSQKRTLPEQETVGNGCLEQNGSCSKTNDHNIKTNCDISEEVLLSIKEIESAFKEDVNDHTTEINKKIESAEENQRSISPPRDNIVSQSLDGSDEQEKDTVYTLKTVNKKIDHPEKLDSPVLQFDQGDQNLDSTKIQNQDNEETFPSSKNQEEGIQEYIHDDDDVIVIEDDDEELPCSQLFDMDCVEDTDNNIEPSDNNENIDDLECWQVPEEKYESDDSDSDAEQWFLRLSQSHEAKSDEDDDSADENLNKSYELKTVGIKPSCNDVNSESIEGAGSLKENLANNREELYFHKTVGNGPSSNDVIEQAVEKVIDPIVNQAIDKRLSENEMSDTYESQVTEPIFRRVPSGGKRKLSESSEEDLNESEVLKTCERYKEDICEEEPADYLKIKKLSNSLQSSAKDSKVRDIIKKSKPRRISDISSDSSSSNRKKPKKNDKLKLTSLEKSSTLAKNKKRLSEYDSDESGSSLSASKIPKKSYNTNEKLSDSLPEVRVGNSLKIKNNQYKLKRQLSSDTDSSESSDHSTSNRNNEAGLSPHLALDDPYNNEILDLISGTNDLKTNHMRQCIPPPENQSANSKNMAMNQEQDKFISLDVEDQIKPSKILKSVEQSDSSKLQDTPKQSSKTSKLSKNKSSNSAGSSDKLSSHKKKSKSSSSSSKTESSHKSGKSGDNIPQDKTVTKTKVPSTINNNSESLVAKTSMQKEHSLVNETEYKSTKEGTAARNINSERSTIEENVIETGMTPGTSESKPKKLNSTLTDDKNNPGANEAKLTEVSKKINASHRKKVVPIIEAKSIRTGRKSVSSESDTISKNDVQTQENKNEQWLSNNNVLKTNQYNLSKADVKALRKEKLKDIAMKDALENKQKEKPKSFTATKKTKTTSKSRNDMFLQDLVSKEIAVVDKSDKQIKDAPLASYKIPRRPSNTEDRGQITESISSSIKESKRDVECKTSTTVERSLPKPVPDKSKLTSAETTQKPSLSATPIPSLVDQILNSANSNNNTLKGKTSSGKTSVPVGGVENVDPVKPVYLEEQKYNELFQRNNLHPHSKPKSIFKRYPTPKDKRKRIKFNFSRDDTNVIYVGFRIFEVDSNCKFKPVTKSVSKDSGSNMKAKKPSFQKGEDSGSTSYADELTYTMCNWNVHWLEEKKHVQKKDDPPVFSGQMYHLTGEFYDFKDYRRSIYPLLAYELWGNISRQYDLTLNTKTNPPFNIQIKGINKQQVSDVFYPSGKTLYLEHLTCQVLLDKRQQSVWPRAGDVVVLSIMLNTSVVNDRNSKPIVRKAEKRIFAYVLSCPPPKPIFSHSDVSPQLRQQSPNANLYVNDLKIVMKFRQGGDWIDTTQVARFIVIKNIKPDLRIFDALDRLPNSPLSQHIYQPRRNFITSNIHSGTQPAQPLVDHLNTSQKKAVMTIAKGCLEDTPMIHLVHGPPGCGKSEVIVNIILQMWVDWFRTNHTTGGFRQILLCAPSNSAVDDIVSKLVNRRDNLLRDSGIPKFDVVRGGVHQSTHESCSHLTLDYLTKKELKRLKEVKNDEEQKRIEFQRLEAKKYKLNQKLESLDARQRNFGQYGGYDKNKEFQFEKEKKDTEKKLYDIKARIKYLESGTEPSEREMAAKHKETQFEILQKVNIVATTLSSCYNGIMAEAFHRRFIKFDCCIVDEATQCIEPDTLIPLILGVKKLVLVGDPRQLPATVNTNTAKTHGLEKSLFARHYDWWKKHQQETGSAENPCHFLNIQYRMHPEIAKWPSEYFYENKLLTQELLRDRSVTCPLVPYVVLSHTNQQSEGECNYEESRIVASLVRGITSHQLCQGLSVGVITPYNRQKDDLKKRINLREFPNVEIGTVDSYQGRERDVVIFSCVRTEGVGFLGGPERLNVALTRAKHSLIVVGNFLSLQKDHTWNSLLNNAKSRNVMKYVVNNQSVCSLVFKPNVAGGGL